jgi:hypothetical protein
MASHALLSAECVSLRTERDEARNQIVFYRDRAVCTNCGGDYDGDGMASDCCSCDIAPAEDLPGLVRSARSDADEEHAAWNEAVDATERAQAEAAALRTERDEARALLADVKLWPLSAKPIPEADLERASKLARERGWDKLPGTADPLRTALAEAAALRSRVAELVVAELERDNALRATDQQNLAARAEDAEARVAELETELGATNGRREGGQA